MLNTQRSQNTEVWKGKLQATLSMPLNISSYPIRKHTSAFCYTYLFVNYTLVLQHYRIAYVVQ